MINDKVKYRIFEHISDVDISEQDIYDYDPEVLDKLLIDHTMSAKARKDANDQTKVVNIFWGTNDYVGAVKDECDNALEVGYGYKDQILPKNITGFFRRIVMPRVLKDKDLQIARSKDKAEVFTPSWVCNAQNNLIDEAWFGRKNVFNKEVINTDGTHDWIPTEGKICFSDSDKKKSWKKYVVDNRMEITCGEAPYLVSRYDTTTGRPIPIEKRIGILDRKLRVIGENTKTPGEWLDMARKAYQHTYGYEWQGDNLLLAREALLYTFIEYYIYRFNEKDENGKIILKNVPERKSIAGIARIISWNLWQMDGIKMVVPESCDNVYDTDLFGEITKRECIACKNGESIGHIGEKCLIRDWNMKRPKDYIFKPGEDPKSSPWQKITFASLFSNGRNNNNEEDE